MGAMMAEYQPSLARSARPKIQAVTEWTRMATGRAKPAHDGHLVGRARLLGGHERKVHHVDGQVQRDNADVPEQGRQRIRPRDYAPHALDAAQVDEHEHTSAADAHRRQDDGGQRHLLVVCHVEHACRRGHDEAAGREAHEEHEHGDVEAPRGAVRHAGDAETVCKLVDPRGDSRYRERAEHARSLRSAFVEVCMVRTSSLVEVTDLRAGLPAREAGRWHCARGRRARPRSRDRRDRRRCAPWQGSISRTWARRRGRCAPCRACTSPLRPFPAPARPCRRS